VRASVNNRRASGRPGEAIASTGAVGRWLPRAMATTTPEPVRLTDGPSAFVVATVARAQARGGADRSTQFFKVRFASRGIRR